MNISDCINEELYRKYPVWWVGFVKYRQTHETRFKNFGEAGSLFRKYKKKYKSAFMHLSPPPGHLLKSLVTSKNVLLEKLKRTDFVGNTITTPLKYRNE